MEYEPVICTLLLLPFTLLLLWHSIRYTPSRDGDLPVMNGMLYVEGRRRLEGVVTF